MRNMTQAASTSCELTVLFADIAGSTQLYERAGDAQAHQLVANCLQVIRREIEGSHGRVIKHTGDGLMATFPNANAAAEAALRTHHAVTEIPARGAEKVSVRIAFHTGTVIERGDDVFGDTVNIAARILELASPGRAILTAESREKLHKEWRSLSHPMQTRSLRGVSRLLELFEFVCESTGDLTILQSLDLDLGESPELQIEFGEQSIVLNGEHPNLSMGRDPKCALHVSDGRASREHAYIELRGDKFVLVDRSSNGTFVTIEGEREFVLSHEEIVLHHRGQLALGRPCSESAQTIRFAHL